MTHDDYVAWAMSAGFWLEMTQVPVFEPLDVVERFEREDGGEG